MIPVLYRAGSSYLLRHPWQLALAVLGISIGVAVIVAVDLANASSRKAFLLSMDAVTGEATHQVVGGPGGIDEKVYARLRVEHGLRQIAPVVEGFINFGTTSLQIMGIDLFAERDMRAFSIGSSAGSSADSNRGEAMYRDFLTIPGAVLMSGATAKALGVAVGDSFEVIAGGVPRPATLIATFADTDAAGLENLVTTDIATAQEWLGLAGRLSRIDVRLGDGDAAALTRLESLLPPGTTVLTAAGRTQTTADMSAAFMTNLTAMSLLALLVGLFLIYNSVSFSVLQRRHLIGILRALGVTRAQTFALVLIESGTIGVIAAAAGVVGGIWLGEQLLGLVSQSINDFYFRVSVTEVAVGPFSIAKGMIAGVGASLVAAAVPAIEAASYQPRLAMVRSALEQRARRALPLITLTGVALLGIALVMLAWSGRNSRRRAGKG